MENPFDEIRAKLEGNEIREGLSRLSKLIPSTANDWKNNVSTLLSRLNDLEEKDRTGLISGSDFSITKSKIIHDTLLLTGEVETLKDTEASIQNNPSTTHGEKPNNQQTPTVNKSVYLKDVNNQGKLTINYNKNVIQVVIIVIVLMLIGGYFLWPDLKIYFNSNEKAIGQYSVVSHSYIIDRSSAEIMPPFLRIDFKPNGLANVYPSVSIGPNTGMVQTREYTESDDIVLVDFPLINLTLSKLENKNLQLPYMGKQLLYLRSE